MAGSGKVYLVGGGPGDPRLITVRGRQVLAGADVVFYDALVPAELLRSAPRAEPVFVGKRGGQGAAAQDDIIRRLIDAAKAGRTVVRLKGGDPFVFGRGGEEALALAAAGIDFEVVPGVTAGVAAPAAAGIPVTQRGVASAVAFVTGHEDPTKGQSDLDYDALARVGTLVFYMGLKRLGEIADRLIAAGMKPDTPAATIMNGTLPSQRTVTAPLAEIADAVAEAGLAAPAVTVVGPVAALRDRLAWLERRPLFGRRIVVTRTRRQASALSEKLTVLGADVTEMPTIRIEPPASWQPLDEAIGQLGGFDWIAFTSPNGVAAFFDRLAAADRDSRALGGVRIAAIGPGTAAALTEHGLRADVIPPRFRAEPLAEAMREADEMAEKRVLLPRADIAREALASLLREAGADVFEVVAYRTVPADAPPPDVLDDLAAGRFDWVTFTSSSTARNFARLVPGQVKARFASIGPITSATARDLGMDIAVEAREHSIDGLVRALVAASNEQTQTR